MTVFAALLEVEGTTCSQMRSVLAAASPKIDLGPPLVAASQQVQNQVQTCLVFDTL